ncbi:PhzF family phenazine biosynthesis protein [Acidocella sp.]|uniref:PhzF family phenazine biosynthesis protein n=1 Tax=Acidocella sp. TaxID=50710 RepID=UPI003D03C3A9
MKRFAFSQMDVFTGRPGLGNPLAVVHGAVGLSDAEMRRFANWTNLSETSFLLPPDQDGADYKVRIFTPKAELPFAGHPTLGSCHAWLAAGSAPKGDWIVQQCGAGLVRIKRDGARLAFAAPGAVQGDVTAALKARIAAVLGVPEAELLALRQLSERAPCWTGVMLKDRQTLLALKPDFTAMGELEIGVVAPIPGGETDFEVRGFAGDVGGEDPVTGSLNAGLARWLIPAGRAPARYVAAQGTALGRAGRVFVDHDGRDFWIGGESVEVVSGTLTL